ncbi:unnamed protein product [Bursaphelenchus okinawaensis]|uniref:Peptidase A1 domain-containing protein n=1 Tax=Bursaphelenchus okinawaensis TaxID=465554 RepID=A0A811LEA8_9BILA|nr:unnamed protein product [Bursaphelenchus okinawaensis]CAG9121635.1 unnamed protein product [Bursaphelenchus okinawaensis]
MTPIFALLLFGHTVTCVPFFSFASHSQSYSSNIPTVDIQYKYEDKDYTIPSIIDLNTEVSLVFSQKCKGKNKCTAEELTTVEVGIPDGEKYNDSSYDPANEFLGYFYDFQVKLRDLTQQHKILTITEGKGEQEYEASGRLGLGFGDADYKIVDKLFDGMDDHKTIYIYEGEYKHRVQDNDGRIAPVKQSGEVSFGKEIDSCKDLKYVQALEHDGKPWWQVEADITIGNLTFEKQKVAFNPSRRTFVNSKTFDTYFKTADVDSLADLPKFTIKIGNNEYVMEAKDYAEERKKDDKTYYSAFIGKVATNDYDFVFGYEFLQKKCLALRRNNNKYEVGLSPSAGNNVKIGSFVLILSVLVGLKFF